MTAHAVRVNQVLTGKAVPFRGAERSAIQKAAREGPIQLTWLGLVGDEQADPRYHGGRDKAIHHYAFDHYPMWASQAPDPLRLSAPGAFGENISTRGLTDDTVCIGDRYRLGSALVEVSQPRQPCWKQAQVLAWPTLPKLMVRAAKSGWYYRVIEEGAVAAGDMLTLTARPHADWPVTRAFSLVMHKLAIPDRAALRAMAALDMLEAEWRGMAAALAGV